MKKKLFFLSSLGCFFMHAQTMVYDWVIVGAGPAGIITVGVLLELGVAPSTIMWIDPAFNVGRMGEKYGNIPANTQTKLFVDFINACQTFKQCSSPAIAELYNYDQEKEYALQIIIDPLQDISNYLRTLVHSQCGAISLLDFADNDWHVGVQDRQYKAHHVVLATGSHPRSLDYQCDTEIPLEVALNKQLLAQVVTPNDSVAVVGGAHSAVLVMKFLSELPVGRILNFYQKPLVFPVDTGTWIMNLYEGLKGSAAQWAHDVLEKQWPSNLVRIFNSNCSRKAWLPVCNKIVYAIGYDRNNLPCINGSSEIAYDSLTGKIGSRLFGIGIAFPETHTYPTGATTPRIGLNSFMEYAQRIIPQWLATKKGGNVARNRFRAFEELFTIELL